MDLNSLWQFVQDLKPSPDSNTMQVLQDLHAGMDAQFYSDALTMQIAKTGITIITVMCGIASFYYLLASMGVLGRSKRSLFSFIAIFFFAFGCYKMYEKGSTLRVIDDSKPVIFIKPDRLEYDIRTEGWSIPWSNIDSVELKSFTNYKKNSVPETTYEIHVNVKYNGKVTWKYEPSVENNMANVKELYAKKSYLLLDPTPLGIDPPALQKALEKYRTGH